MTEKEFEKIYKAQHRDLRSVDRDQKLSTKKSIVENGFQKAINANATPLFRYRMNDFSDRFANKAGDMVYLIKKGGFVDRSNGYQINENYKPTDEEVFFIEYDYQPTYEAYTNQFIKMEPQKTEAEILAEIETKIKESCTTSRYNNLCMRTQTPTGMAYVVNRCVTMMGKDKIHLSSALAILEAEEEGID